MIRPQAAMTDRLALSLLAVVWLAFVVVVYCPDIGRGFVKDDFTWIRAAQTTIADPSALVAPREAGFYRPLVRLTFILDYTLHGWRPRGYGWTNLALYSLSAVSVFWLALTLGLGRWAAGMAGLLWAVNPHGINMAVLWLSGRTALCLTLFAVGAAIAFVRRSYGAGAVLIALALASKEEAIVLPLVLMVWAWPFRRDNRLPTAAVAAAWIPLIAYLLVRRVTPAFTPSTAPWFYRLSSDPVVLARNVAEYVDRSVTLPAAAVLTGLVIWRVRPSFSDRDKRIAAMLGVWWMGMFAITVWLPVRSSLYAVCPSVATAVLGAGILERMRARVSPTRRWLEPLFAIALLAAIPLYRARNSRWVEPARVSERTLSAIQSDLPALPPRGAVVLHDGPNGSSFDEVFGDLVTEALRTRFGREWTGWIDSSRVSVSAGPPPSRSSIIAEYRIEGGRVSRAAP